MNFTRIVIGFLCMMLWHTAIADSLTDKISIVKTTLSHDEQQQNTLQQQLKNLEISLGLVNEEVNRIALAEANERYLLKKLLSQQQKTQTELSKQQKLLGAQVRSAYLLGQPNEIKIIFNQENPNTLNRQLYYYHLLMQNHLGLMNSIKQSLQSLATTLVTITEHQSALEKLLAEKNTQQQKLLALDTERHELLTHLNQKIDTEEHELNELLVKLKAETLSINPTLAFASLHGKLSWPVSGTVVSAFGSKIDTASDPLSGVVIKAPEGTPVHAIAPGKVIFANWLRGFGLLIIIDHGNGYMSLYARNESLSRKSGDTVKTGETIAATGTSGGFRTPGLYFEIRQNGLPLNPNLWCG